MPFGEKNMALGTVILLISALVPTVQTRTDIYAFPGNVCDRILKEKDAVVLDSKYSSAYAHRSRCNVKLEVSNDLLIQYQFMFKVVQWNVSRCEHQLKIVFEKSGVATEINLGCKNSSSQEVYFTSGPILLFLVPYLTPSDRYKLHFTRVKSQPFKCRSILCEKTRACIDDDLYCDGIDNCFDGTDENATVCNGFQILNSREVSQAVLITLLLSLLVICFLCCVVAACLCKQTKRKGFLINSQATCSTTMPSNAAGIPMQPLEYKDYTEGKVYQPAYPAPGYPPEDAGPYCAPPPYSGR